MYGVENEERTCSYLILTGQSVTLSGVIDPEQLQTAWISPGKDTNRYRLDAKDIVVLARGSAIRPGLITPEIAQLQPLASANFLIVRCDPKKLQPEYLMSFLATNQGEEELRSLANGTAIQSVSAASLNELTVPLPTLSIQSKIAELYLANKRAYAATIALAEQQKLTTNAKIAHMIWG